MNNIYVDELPKSCWDCKCAFKTLRQQLNEFGSYMEDCMCCIPLNEWLVKKHPNCPLKPLSDRLAEERKKVVQEIRETIFEYLKVNSMEDLQKLSLLESTLTYDVITDKLDQIERGE